MNTLQGLRHPGSWSAGQRLLALLALLALTAVVATLRAAPAHTAPAPAQAAPGAAPAQADEFKLSRNGLNIPEMTYHKSCSTGPDYGDVLLTVSPWGDGRWGSGDEGTFAVVRIGYAFTTLEPDRLGNKNKLILTLQEGDVVKWELHFDATPKDQWLERNIRPEVKSGTLDIIQGSEQTQEAERAKVHTSRDGKAVFKFIFDHEGDHAECQFEVVFPDKLPPDRFAGEVPRVR